MITPPDLLDARLESLYREKEDLEDEIGFIMGAPLVEVMYARKSLKDVEGEIEELKRLIEEWGYH